jgi:hypothetical protein
MELGPGCLPVSVKTCRWLVSYFHRDLPAWVPGAVWNVLASLRQFRSEFQSEADSQAPEFGELWLTKVDNCLMRRSQPINVLRSRDPSPPAQNTTGKEVTCSSLSPPLRGETTCISRR